LADPVLFFVFGAVFLFMNPSFPHIVCVFSLCGSDALSGIVCPCVEFFIYSSLFAGVFCGVFLFLLSGCSIGVCVVVCLP